MTRIVGFVMCVLMCVSAFGMMDKATYKQLREQCRKTGRFPRPEPERVKVIEAMLPEHPFGMGYPVANREKWDGVPDKDMKPRAVRKAEEILVEKIPELRDEDYLLYTTTGNRTIYQKPYFARRKRLYTLAVAEALENQGRFL